MDTGELFGFDETNDLNLRGARAHLPSLLRVVPGRERIKSALGTNWMHNSISRWRSTATTPRSRCSAVRR